MRTLLAMMVPLFAIGFTGLLVSSVGRLLLSIDKEATPVVALGLTIAIMLGCTIASALFGSGARSGASGRH